MSSVGMVIIFPCGTTWVRRHTCTKGLRLNDRRPVHILISKEASESDTTAANYAVHPLCGKVTICSFEEIK